MNLILAFERQGTRQNNLLLSGHHTSVRPYFYSHLIYLAHSSFDSHQTWYMTPSRLYNHCWYVFLVQNLLFCEIKKKLFVTPAEYAASEFDLRKWNIIVGVLRRIGMPAIQYCDQRSNDPGYESHIQDALQGVLSGQFKSFWEAGGILNVSVKSIACSEH